MTTIHDAIRFAHIASGTVALAAFWTTAMLKKGTPTHRRTGGVYMGAMLGVLGTSPLLAAYAFAAGRTVLGTFLLYLVLITASALWLAWRAIRDRRDTLAYFGALHRALAWTNVAGGLTVLATGVYSRSYVLAGMSLIGLIAGYQMIALGNAARAGRAAPGWWVRRHIAAICGCGVATHIAFMNLGLAHALPAQYAVAAQLAGWFGPVVFGTIAARMLDRRYGGGRLAAA